MTDTQWPDPARDPDEGEPAEDWALDDDDDESEGDDNGS
jgi:hypothetical protein